METQDIVIISLTILTVYFFYQNNQPSLTSPSENPEQITELQQEVQHYQNLYQKRVQKDVEADQTEKVKKLTENNQQLAENLSQTNQQNSLYQQKINAQDTALLNLARSKIKGKKEAETLLNELETKWSKKEIEWEQEQK